MLYFAQDIPAKLLSHDVPFIESFLLRLIFAKRNGLLTVLTIHIRVVLANIWS